MTNKGLTYSFCALLVAVLSCSDSLYAQHVKDTTLNAVKVHGKRKVSNDSRVNDFSPGQKISTIDSATLQQYQLQSLASLLSQQQSVFIKSYGFNSLSTINFRGSSAAQSQVLWNGVPIQNAALGIADVSTLPVFFVNKLNVVYGSSAALWGSGNVGGALLIEDNTPVFGTGKKALSLSGGIGSFGQYMGGLSGSISRKRWYFSLNAFTQTAANDFSYTNNSGVAVNMTNSRLRSEAILTKVAYRINKQNALSLSAWYQQYDRQIPPSLFEAGSVKKQVDGSLRTLLDWSRLKGNEALYYKASFIRDEIRYTDNAVQVNTDNKVNQFYQEIGYKADLKELGRVLWFAPIQVSWLDQPDGVKQQSKVAFAGAWDIKLLNRKLDVAVNARAELISQHTYDTIANKNDLIFLPGINASYTLFSWLSLRANIQRTYRAPTLNELYYFPGGNTSLKPEQGWNGDAGYTVNAKPGRFTVHHDLAVFTRDINDWIIWFGGAIWTPHNIAEVRSRGVETENNITCSVGNWKLFLGANTSYILATTISSYITNDGSIGRQIPYTPRYNGQAKVGFTYRQLSLSYIHTYTGYRFTTTDESAWLAPYQTGNLQLMFTTAIRQHQLQLTGQCNNIWNERYEVVDQRPMPGINWLLGVKVQVLD